MKQVGRFYPSGKDLWITDGLAGLSVFLVAIPLCLGIALASGAPIISGLLAGIIGGIIVGICSNSGTSVSGPAAGNIAIILAAIEAMGSFRAILLSVVLSGVIQICFGFARFSTVIHYVPSSVILGLLGAIGIVIIVKQLPYLFGYSINIREDFILLDEQSRHLLSHAAEIVQNINIPATIIGITSILVMIFWHKIPCYKMRTIPSSVATVIIGVIIVFIFSSVFLTNMDVSTFVNIPVLYEMPIEKIKSIFITPIYSDILNFKVHLIAITLSVVASIETLLNIKATDKLDRHKRHTDPDQELIAQGVGNVLCGIIGGLPITSVVMRSSVGINSGSYSKRTTIIHGVLILICVVCVPNVLNQIPFACLAGILIVTGYKLIRISSLREIYSRGYDQFIPFIVTLVSIICTDLLIGVGCGIVTALFFVIKHHHKISLKLTKEEYSTGKILRIELPAHVSFLNINALTCCLTSIPSNSSVFIDARQVKHMEHDVIELIREFKAIDAPSKKIAIHVIGLKKTYNIASENHRQFAGIVTKRIQRDLSPDDVIKILANGNRRFVENTRLNRDLVQQMKRTVTGQHPMAAILSCIDSRTSAELIFDLGFGDIFSIRIAGNIANSDIVGSLEFACKISGAKLVVVLGHTKCSAIQAACDNLKLGRVTGIVKKINTAIKMETKTITNRNAQNKAFVENVTKININCVRSSIIEQSKILREMALAGDIKIIGGLFDIKSGCVKFED